ncbi:CRISPR-associated endonuclease Cas2 [Azonexus sp.]|uniref:CRISPR-associated endonuclease Cas2 n=1 Tax=Azonexus sp. TaxID=1872668 RepID=UPI0039E3F720
MHSWLIGYDITCPRRLQRVHRVMVNYATPIEYSVFLLVGSEKDLAHCLAAINTRIDARTDDVRCYPLPTRGLQERVGCSTLPTGIQWSALPAGLWLG